MFRNNFSKGMAGFIYGFLFILVVSSLFIGAAIYMKGDKFRAAESVTIEGIRFPENYAVKGDWIYYVSLYDNFIYKMKKDGSSRELVSDNKAAETGIILSGDWIYYINVPEGYCLYRVNTDGGGNRRIGLNEITIENTDFFTWSDSIYYTDYTDSVHRIDPSGNDERIKGETEENLLSRINRFGQMYDGSIYFSDDNGIYKMDMHSGSPEKLSDDTPYSGIKVDRDYAYYISSQDYMLYRISTNGRNKEKLSENPVVLIGPDYDSGNFEIAGNMVYFTSLQNNDKCELLSFNMDNGEIKRLVTDMIHFTVNDGKIYYMDGTDYGDIYQRDIKDPKNIRLLSGQLIPYIDVKEGMIFFMVKSSELNQPVWGRIFVLGKGKEFELK